jgi:hypothetical protein
MLNDDRFIHGRLNYTGDLTKTFDMDRSYGPNTLGEPCWPVNISYDKKRKRTVVEFSFTAPVEVKSVE